jgi:hypothetical protein
MLCHTAATSLHEHLFIVDELAVLLLLPPLPQANACAALTAAAALDDQLAATVAAQTVSVQVGNPFLCLPAALWLCHGRN